MTDRSIALAVFAVLASAASISLPVRAFGANAAAGSASAPEDALIEHGLELREQHDDIGALAEFQRAYRLSTSGRALAQVALAEQALGRWVDAQTHLTEALRRSDAPWIIRNDKLLRQSLFNIQGHTGSLEITGAVAGADILINNEVVGTFPMPPVLVPAGSVGLEVRAPGYLPVIRTVLIPARGLAREPVVLVAAPPAPAIVIPKPTTFPSSAPMPAARREVGTPSEAGWSSRNTVGAAIAAGGVASLGVGIAYQIVREQHAGTFNSHGCGVTDDVVTGPRDCPSRYDDIKGAQKIAIAGFVGAALLGGVGTYLILSTESVSHDAPTAHAGLRCLPAAGLGVTCAARF